MTYLLLWVCGSLVALSIRAIAREKITIGDVVKLPILSWIWVFFVLVVYTIDWIRWVWQHEYKVIWRKR